MTSPPYTLCVVRKVTDSSEIPCRVSENEPVLAYNGGALPRCGLQGAVLKRG